MTMFKISSFVAAVAIVGVAAVGAGIAAQRGSRAPAVGAMVVQRINVRLNAQGSSRRQRQTISVRTPQLTDRD